MTQQTPPKPARAVPDSALRFIGFLSFFDRYGTPPMLLALSLSTSLDFSQTVQLIAAYSLFYAIGQPLWGLVSDRFGRLLVMRSALVGAGIGALASIMFSDYVPLLVARCFTGLMFGALYPTLLTLLGDTRQGVERARGLSDLQVYSSLGTILATVSAGALATYLDWRLVFALPAVGCVAALYSLRQVREPQHSRTGFSLAAAMRTMNVTLYAIVFLEGALLMGLLTYVVPALQRTGVSVGLAGVLGCAFAIGVILGARLMRRLVARFSRTWLIGCGGLLLCGAFLPSAFWPSAFSYTATALLLGATNAIMHSSMQGWATDIAPDARATTVSFFVFSLFAGASLATYLSASMAEQGHYAQIFGYGLALSLVLVVVATGTHALWRKNTSAN